MNVETENLDVTSIARLFFLGQPGGSAKFENERSGFSAFRRRLWFDRIFSSRNSHLRGDSLLLKKKINSRNNFIKKFMIFTLFIIVRKKLV